MFPRIKTLSEKKLIGFRQNMNYAAYNPVPLWQRFMPRRKEIINALSSYLYFVHQFNDGFWVNFNPDKEFEQWAAVEVTNFDKIPSEMDSIVIPAGLYAVFDYKGNAGGASEFYQYIFGIWLPNSDYVLDNRPHFEILGEKYTKDDPNSEEEICIPIRLK